MLKTRIQYLQNEKIPTVIQPWFISHVVCCIPPSNWHTDRAADLNILVINHEHLLHCEI